MENQEKTLASLFQQLGKQTAKVDTPDFKLKDAVFSTIDATSVIADIVDLFTLQFVKAQAEVVDALPGNDYGINQKQKLLKYFEKKYAEKRLEKPSNEENTEGSFFN
jgi:hypothetical protein